MKRIIIGVVIALASIPDSQIIQAQGTMTYLSNLDQASAGSLAVGSDSWLAFGFRAGSNAGGYALDSVQLAMTDASGNPNGFTAFLYSAALTTGGPFLWVPGRNLGRLRACLKNHEHGFKPACAA